MIFLCPGMFSKIKIFPQCTPYMYILIYRSRALIFLQTPVHIYKKKHCIFRLHNWTVITILFSPHHRDDPKAEPVFVCSNKASVSCEFTVLGQNLFAAVR